jgi:NADPH-dependent ferric siderophore reductase
LVRVTFAGPGLAGLTIDEPAASVRLLLPPPGREEIVVPVWNGNQFLLPGGDRPTIRTLTPIRVDSRADELDVDIVLHGSGAASGWAAAAGPGAPAALSGPGRGYTVDGDAAAFLIGGDETAIPAIGQLLAAIPDATPVRVLIEVAHPDARIDLAGGRINAVEWLDLAPGAAPGDALVAAVEQVALDENIRVWVAGEAAAVQRIRRHLFHDRGLPRAQVSVRGYWKHGRGGDAEPG